MERLMRHASCGAGATTRELETLSEKCFPTVRSRSYGWKIWATWLNKLSNLAQLQGQDSSFKRCFGLGWWDGTHVAARWDGPTTPPGGAYFVYFFFVCLEGVAPLFPRPKKKSFEDLPVGLVTRRPLFRRWVVPSSPTCWILKLCFA